MIFFKYGWSILLFQPEGVIYYANIYSYLFQTIRHVKHTLSFEVETLSDWAKRICIPHAIT